MFTRFFALALLFVPALFAVLSLQAQSRPVGMNLSYIYDYSAQFTFVDAMKQCRPWIVRDVTETIWQTDTVPVPSRRDGYPLQVPFYKNGVPYKVHTLMLREHVNPYPGGTYTLIFEGKGRIRLDFDAGNRVYTAPNVAHHFTVTPSGNGIHLTIDSSYASDPVRNIRVIMPGFESTYLTQPFHPRFLDLLKNFSVLRHLHTQDVNYSFLRDTAFRTTPDFYTQANRLNGEMAYEYIAKLCNTLNTDAWINIPHLANDTLVAEIARIFRDSLAPGRKIYVEYSNETWNSAYPYSFVQQHTQQRGVALGLSNNTFQAGLYYTAYRSFEIFRIFRQVFNNDTTRFVRVLASQASNPWTGLQLLQSMNIPGNNPLQERGDVIAIAPYFGGEIGDELVNAGVMNSISVNAILDTVEARMINRVGPSIQQYKTYANNYGVKLVAYEGGQHLVGVQHQNDTALVRKLAEANRHPRMENIYCNYYNYWYNNGGDLFIGFDFVGSYSRYGSFGNLEYLYQDTTNAPKWRALNSCVFPYNTCSNYLWVGAINNLWDVGGNWSCGTVPTRESNAVIPSGTVLVNVDATVKSLFVHPSAQVTVATGKTLTLAQH